MKMYCILSDAGYWNNDIGWIEWREDATLFSYEETLCLRLPLGANVKWEPYERR
jgi:hypothetical protein